MAGRGAHERKPPALAGPLALGLVVGVACVAAAALLSGALAALRLLAVILVGVAVARLAPGHSPWLSARQRPWLDAIVLFGAALSIWVLSSLSASTGVL
ncbi:DUF3017 domain-containing protein [Buchananella felis]|uniref:DUF3017 domain-containing protein n=1 Tax=Buchananella felis TaxID=3231492 RepID=UPI0035295884